METCVNCACQFHDRFHNNSSSIIKDDKSEDCKVFNVYPPLSSIYKLNYLSAFLDSSIFESKNKEIWKLCENCLGVFTNLYQFYEDFNQLRSLESKLAVEIQKLDDYIQENSLQREHLQPQQEQNKNKRKQNFGVSPYTFNDHVPADDGLPTHEEEHQQQKRTRIIKVEVYSSDSPHPKVILQRVEEDPIAQEFLSPSKSKSKSKSTSTSRKRVKKAIPIRKSQKCTKKTRKRVKKRYVECDDDDDPLFVPSPKSEQEEEDDDEYLEEEKNTKKGKGKKTIKTEEDEDQKSKRVISDDPEVKKKRRRLAELHKRKFDSYKIKKTKFPHPCWECELHFPTQKECYDHTIQEHAQPGLHHYVCETCSKRCKSVHGIKIHREQFCHTLKPGQLLPVFNCEICEGEGKTVTFPLLRRLKQHLKQGHHEGELRCEVPDCSFTTTVPASMYKHTKYQHAESPEPVEERTCQACQKVFKSKEFFKGHYKRVHTEEGIQRYKESVERRKERDKDKPKLSDVTFCSECMVDMLTHNGLVAHRRLMHSDTLNSNFVCDECGKGFPKKNVLQRHKTNVHTEERKFVCHQCARSFKTNSALTTHLRIAHDEEGRLKFNASVRLQTQRRKIRNRALVERLSAGIPQFTGAKFTDSNNSISHDDGLDNTDSSNNIQSNDLSSLQ